MEPRSRERGNDGWNRQSGEDWRASMEPRSRERGNQLIRPGSPRRTLCFNGAALKRARKSALFGAVPPVDMGFNGAALKRARKSGRRSASPCGLPCFNGAALKRARKSPDAFGAGVAEAGMLQWSRAQESAEINHHDSGGWRRFLASMEPRSRERGNRPDRRERHRQVDRFNGAALKRARKLRPPPPRQHVPGRFNGAALKRARKSLFQQLGSGPRSKLQWSRAQESAEISQPYSRTQPSICFNGAALKRARKFGTGRSCGPEECRFNGAALKRARKCPSSRSPWARSRCFNGAALKRARKYAAKIQRRAALAASMEPRSRERGNHAVPGFSHWEPLELQWSRAQESAEMRPD